MTVTITFTVAEYRIAQPGAEGCGLWKLTRIGWIEFADRCGCPDWMPCCAVCPITF